MYEERGMLGGVPLVTKLPFLCHPCLQFEDLLRVDQGLRDFLTSDVRRMPTTST